MHRLERFIEKIKPYRRICSRFEKLKQSLLIGTYPLTPFLRGRGNCERFCEGIDKGYLIALCPRKTPSEQPERETIKGTLLPFPRRHRRSLQ